MSRVIMDPVNRLKILSSQMDFEPAEDHLALRLRTVGGSDNDKANWKGWR